MISRFARALLTAAALVTATACAHPGINPEVEQDELTPPSPIGGMSNGPALVGATVQQPVNLDILVRVDTLGRADLSTLEVTGPGAAANRQAVMDWLRTARFEPARMNGYPVAGWFRVKAEAKASAVRED